MASNKASKFEIGQRVIAHPIYSLKREGTIISKHLWAEPNASYSVQLNCCPEGHTLMFREHELSHAN